MKLTQKWVLELDAVWVDQILATAFDANHGGANWWAEDEFDSITPQHRPLHVTETSPLWLSVILSSSSFMLLGEHQVVLGIQLLTTACEKLINGEVVEYEVLGTMLLEALQENDPSQIDSGLSDLIVQVALFGEVRH